MVNFTSKIKRCSLSFTLAAILSIIIVECKLHKESGEKGGLKEKAQLYLEIAKVYTFMIFEYLELFTMNFHNFLLQYLQVEYPCDLLIFIGLGFTLKWVRSLFTFPQKFVYNLPDQPDLTIILNNVK